MTATPPSTVDTNGITLAPLVAFRLIARRFWPSTRGLRRWIALSLVLVILVPAIETLKIWMFKILIDDVLVPKDFDPFMMVAVAFIGLTIAGGLASIGDDVLSAWVGQRFVLSIRCDVFRHMHRISLVQLGRRKVGDLIARLTGDVGAIEGFVIGGMTDAIAFGAEAAFFLAALFYLSWDLALVALIVIPAFWFTAQRFSSLIRDTSRERRRRSGAITALAEESLSHAGLVQAYNRHDAQAARFRTESEANMRVAMRSTRLQAIFSPTVETIEAFGAIVVIGYGVWKLTNNQLSIGALLVFLTYLTQLYDPIRGLSKLMTSLHSAAAGAERVIEILDEPVGVENADNAQRPSTVAGAIRLENVSYRYDAERPAAVQGVSVDFAKGTTTVLAGPNGAGKSTVANLILRLQDPSGGCVLLDGVDLRDLDVGWLRDNMAMVMQDGGIWDASIRDNLLFGKPDATDEEITSAARRAGLHDVVMSLPDAYETIVGPRGSRLSGGQRQRLAIARALVRDAPIVILDEPTNHLDRVAAESVRRAIRELAAGRTTIVISHDPELIAEADVVVTFSDGRIVPDTPNIPVIA